MENQLQSCTKRSRLWVVSAVWGAETEHIWRRLMKTGRGLNLFISEETPHRERIIELVLVEARLR